MFHLRMHLSKHLQPLIISFLTKEKWCQAFSHTEHTFGYLFRRDTLQILMCVMKRSTYKIIYLYPILPTCNSVLYKELWKYCEKKDKDINKWLTMCCRKGIDAIQKKNTLTFYFVLWKMFWILAALIILKAMLSTYTVRYWQWFYRVVPIIILITLFNNRQTERYRAGRVWRKGALLEMLDKVFFFFNRD